jgi:hypothetical protein
MNKFLTYLLSIYLTNLTDSALDADDMSENRTENTLVMEEHRCG